MNNVSRQPSAGTRHTIRWQGALTTLDRILGLGRDVGTIAMTGKKEIAR